MSFEPVVPVRAYERVVEQIESAILSRELRPGDRLPSERELMARFQVSRSTVREALRVLDSKGMVRSRPGDPRGPEVRSLDGASLRSSLTALTRVHGGRLVDVLQFRMIIEGSAYALAARFHDDAGLATIETAMATMEAAVGGDPAAFTLADVAFHDAVAAAAGNDLLRLAGQAVRDAVIDLVRREIVENGAEAMAANCRAHREALAAVRARDATSAARLGRSHILGHYGHLLSADERTRIEAALGDA